MKNIFFILLTVLNFCAFLQACPHFEAGNVFYLQEDYDNALTEYIKCESEPSFSLFYNMGNTYYRLGRYGQARLYYEKARLLGPFARDLSYNNGLLQQYLADEENPRLLSVTETNTDISLGFLWLTMCLFLLAFSRRRLWGRLVLFVCFVLFAGTGVFVGMRIIKRPEIGVILDAEVSLRSGRNPSSAVLAKIHEGRLVSVVAEDDDWALIEVKEGVRGWIATESLGLVRISQNGRSI